MELIQMPLCISLNLAGTSQMLQGVAEQSGPSPGSTQAASGSAVPPGPPDAQHSMGLRLLPWGVQHLQWPPRIGDCISAPKSRERN